MLKEIYKKQGGSIGGFILDFIQSIVLALAVFGLLYLFVYFLIVFLVYFDRNFLNLNYDTLVNNVFRKYAIWQWLEISELYLAIGFLIYTKITLKELKKAEK